ncbi:MAG: hypothetical protein OXG49_18565 [Chloroflexi bacterium]|nr:hypothetical protein [Chloroflexota bacterium]
MNDSPGTIEREFIRHRIETRMTGRRDLLLHLAIYLALAIIYLLNTPAQLPQHYIVIGGLWTIPLILHGLRYYYRCGPGAVARADEIEGAIEEQANRTALDEEEEMLIEERAEKRISARRAVAAHILSAALLLGLLWLLTVIWIEPMFNVPDLGLISQYWGIALALHVIRFCFVHGRTAEGRALKIDSEVDRLWSLSREAISARPADLAGDVFDLGDADGRRLRLNAEGEFTEDFAAEALPERQSRVR